MRLSRSEPNRIRLAESRSGRAGKTVDMSDTKVDVEIFEDALRGVISEGVADCVADMLEESPIAIECPKCGEGFELRKADTPCPKCGSPVRIRVEFE